MCLMLRRGGSTSRESTGSGYESGRGTAEGERELHISSDIAFAL